MSIPLGDFLLVNSHQYESVGGLVGTGAVVRNEVNGTQLLWLFTSYISIFSQRCTIIFN